MTPTDSALTRRTFFAKSIRSGSAAALAAAAGSLGGCDFFTPTIHIVRFNIDESDPNNPKILDDPSQHVVPNGTTEIIFTIGTPNWLFRFKDADSDYGPSPLISLDGDKPERVPSAPEKRQPWWFFTKKVPKSGHQLHFRVVILKGSVSDRGEVILAGGGCGGGGTLVAN